MPCETLADLFIAVQKIFTVQEPTLLNPIINKSNQAVDGVDSETELQTFPLVKSC